MEFIIFFITLIICFFLLYIFSKTDFVLIRQNISLSQIFDAAGVSFIAALLLSRVVYVVNNFRTELLSFLRFFHIARYPGLSFFGFIIGGALCLYLIFVKKKNVSRIMDIFAISFMPLVAVSSLVESTRSLVFIPYLFFIFCIFLFIFFIQSHQKYVLRDGSISLIFLLTVCVQTLIYQYFNFHKNAVFSSFSLLFLVSTIFIPIILVQLFLNQRKKKHS